MKNLVKNFCRRKTWDSKEKKEMAVVVKKAEQKAAVVTVRREVIETVVIAVSVVAIALAVAISNTLLQTLALSSKDVTSLTKTQQNSKVVANQSK